MEKLNNRNIVVGITNLNKLNDWVYEELNSGIDLAYLEAKEDAGIDTNDEEAEETFNDQYESGDYSSVLFGDWIKGEDGLLSIDRNGKNGFSAHYSNGAGYGTVSVLWSRTLKNCAKTSPCFVQSDGSGPCGDLDSEGDDRLAYSLPDDYFSSEFN